jgi:hypothetical protein
MSFVVFASFWLAPRLGAGCLRAMLKFPHLFLAQSYLLNLHNNHDAIGGKAGEIVSELFPTPLIIPLLVVGICLSVLALLGCCGVCKKKQVLGRCALMLYAAVIFVIIIAEISLGSVLFAWEGGSQLGDLNAQESRLAHDLADQIYSDCCNNVTHTVIPSSSDGNCPFPSFPEVFHDSDCVSEDSLADGFTTWLHRVVVPLAGASFGLAGLQIVTFIAICCVAGMGRRQAEELAARRARGEATAPGAVWYVDTSIYGDSASGKHVGAFGNASTTPQYVRF